MSEEITPEMEIKLQEMAGLLGITEDKMTETIHLMKCYMQSHEHARHPEKRIGVSMDALIGFSKFATEDSLDEALTLDKADLWKNQTTILIMGILIGMEIVEMRHA